MNNSLYKNIGYIVLILFIASIAVGFWLWTTNVDFLQKGLDIIQGTSQQRILDRAIFSLSIFSIIQVILALLSITMFIFSSIGSRDARKGKKRSAKKDSRGKFDDKKSYEDYTTVEKIINSLQEIIGKQEYNNENLLEKLLSQICKELEMAQGLVYIMKEKENHKKLSAVANFALYLSGSQQMEYEIGEGLVGQVAKNEEFILIKQVPDNYIKIASGLGESSPNNLAIVPIKSEDADILGVLELASFKEITLKDRETLEEVALLLAREISRSEFIDIDVN